LTNTDGHKSEAVHFFYVEDFGSPDVRPNQDMHNQDTIKICTYNIVTSHNSHFNFALKTMYAMGISMGIFTKKKLIDNTYPTNTHGYMIVATTDKSNHQGGIALFHQTAATSFHLKALVNLALTSSEQHL
jgi:hypothetical protein